MQNRIYAYRMSHGLTQHELALLVGGKTPHLSLWETCQEIPPKPRLHQLAEQMNIDVDRLRKELTDCLEEKKKEIQERIKNKGGEKQVRKGKNI